MEIEYKNVSYADKNIYQVGNIITRIGTPFMVAEFKYSNREPGYCFVDLENGKIFTPECASLDLLSENYGYSKDRLVKAKLIVDYKLDGDTEDEDAK